MKKPQHISLVLITAALASCHRPGPTDWVDANDRHHQVYIRSDSTAPYTYMHHPIGSPLWYYAFRPYGRYYSGHYRRVGYYSDALSERSNVGFDFEKTSVVRGGFGGEYSVSS
ncbi:hypothetical protein [Puia dinghuensis]|uniref:Lipoprotein n=1 Tax=Puia dinghuensis TaxID=1792502 RepID=A0A8J2UDZ5_9BACT|nr:hypothetical protein [Puia dinghuensis]GGB03040.1 hypothetical protein GCM10011511_27920 [Puia dinghuensis]